MVTPVVPYRVFLLQDTDGWAFYSKHMRCLLAGVLGMAAAVCGAADKPAPTDPPAVLSLCSESPGAPACKAPAKDLKAARHAFARGLKLERARKLDEAFNQFQEAARLVPQDVEYLTARELVRQQLAALHLERGNDHLLKGQQVEALAEFRTAQTLDPQNEFAQQRLRDALGTLPVRTAGPPQIVAREDAIAAKPLEGRHDFHYRGDSRALIGAVASSYGLTVIVDDSLPSRRVHFDLEGADFATAIHAASQVTKSFSVALEDKVLFSTIDTPENHRLYDRMGLRSFYIPGGSTPPQLNDLMNALRSLFEFRFASLNAASSTITLRGPQAALVAATEFLAQLDSSRPEVMLDLKVFAVDHSYTRNMGLHIPYVFKLFNIPASALASVAGQNIQDLINQLIASGGINQAGNQSIAALLAQLQGQQNSIFSQPLATFGGGLTLMGLSLDQLRATLTTHENSVRTLEHVTLRASQDKEATFKLGSRLPILNASFAPIFNNSAISQVIQNQSFAAPFPSFNYEDVGLTLKAKPLVHGNSDVSLELELQFRTVSGTNVNGVPIISNREFKGGILLKEGEPAVVAGMITQTDQKSLSGLPALSHIPALGALSSETTKNQEEDELLILITPYVVGSPGRKESPEIWLSK
ncbi:MAG TPA: type II and III secretion system protein [Terriglobales bacterium]|nr:type II and III secretion system protein [Terriglobales bacterium]